jgi:hypothetical protein
VELTKEQMEFLDVVCFDKWTLNENGEVDVEGTVDMSGLGLTEIPVKFGSIRYIYSDDDEWRPGWGFNCSGNNLTTLKNCPNSIENGISIRSNPLTEYFKNIKEEDFPLWKDLYWSAVLEEYPFLINIGKKYRSRDDLKVYLICFPLTKLYYKD